MLKSNHKIFILLSSYSFLGKYVVTVHLFIFIFTFPCFSVHQVVSCSLITTNNLIVKLEEKSEVNAVASSSRLYIFTAVPSDCWDNSVRVKVADLPTGSQLACLEKSKRVIKYAAMEKKTKKHKIFKNWQMKIHNIHPVYIVEKIYIHK